MGTTYGPRTFTPLSLSPALWLSDTGSDPAVWEDLSGNGRNATQGTAANQPAIITNALNGRQVRRFDGSNDVLKYSTPNSLLQNVAGSSIFAVTKWTTSPTTGKVVFAIFVNGSNISSRALIAGGATSGKYYSGGRRLDADSLAVATSTSNISTNSFIIHTSILDYSNSDAFQYLNSILDGSNTTFQTNGNTSDTQSNGFSIGATLGDTIHADIDIAEILVFPTALSTTNRRTVERYLAGKYGITIS